MNNTVENVYARQEVKALAKTYRKKLLAMFAIVYGIVFALTLIAALLENAAGGNVQYTASSTGVQVSASGPITSIFTLISSLLSTVMALGLYEGLIRLHRGDDSFGPGIVFSRFRDSLKAIGLVFWVYLKALLWTLPGLSLIVIGVIVVGTAENVQSVEQIAPTMLLFFGGMILMFALYIPAVYRYQMSHFILADQPERGVRECVDRSKAMMKGHKWQAFKLPIPYYLVMMGVMYGGMFIVALLAQLMPESPVLLLLSVLLLLGLMIWGLQYAGIRSLLSYAVFYNKRLAELEPAPFEKIPVVEAPVEETPVAETPAQESAE